MRVILIRHATACGQSPDADLTKEGHKQADNLSSALANLGTDMLFSSPYKRAKQTILPYARISGLKITTLNNLHERVLSLEPKPDWLTHIDRSFQNRDYALPGAESLNDTFARAQSALTEILKINAKRPAAVSHGNLIASVLHHIDPNFGFESWKTMANPDLYEICFENGQPSSFSRL